MTIDETINHAIELAEEQEAKAISIGNQLVGSAIRQYRDELSECAEHNRHLAAWLTELKELKAADVQPKATCRMTPLEPDCRGYTDVFICTHCHQHIHLGFISKEYSGNFCIECGAEVKDDEQNDT